MVENVISTYMENKLKNFDQEWCDVCTVDNYLKRNSIRNKIHQAMKLNFGIVFIHYKISI